MEAFEKVLSGIGSIVLLIVTVKYVLPTLLNLF